MKKIVMSALTLAIAACMSATPVISASASDDDFVCGTSLAEQELREREFEDISIKAPTKYFYQYGDKLDLSGGAIYADNMLVCYMDSPENCFLPDAQVEIDTHQFVNSDFGVYPVNVRVKINGKEFRQIFCVAVEEPENAAIELADVTIADEAEEVQATGFETLKIKVPDKKYYQYGEKLDLTGGEIYAGDKFICSMTDPTANVEIDTHQFVNSDFGAYPINIKATVDGKNYYGIFCVAVEEPETAVELDDVKIANDDIAYGDVNLDGRVSISDSVAVLQFIANPEKYALTDEQKANADVHNTGDGVTLKDAEAIGAFAEGMIDLF
ncbi:MAG: dockerin type I repeat-containing protein [Ruminococcus sp.]|nr:dockerin type I repeat-containing protein [Ruminococcus sp.]